MGGRLLRALAAAAAARARAHPGSARRGRGLRVPRAPSAPSCARRCKSIHDIERLVARAALGTAGPRDLVVAAPVDRRGAARAACCSSELQAPLVRSLVAELDDLADIRDALDRDARRRAAGASRATAASSATASIAELDDLRGISRCGKQRIAEMEEAERARTGICSLKIRYNRVFGYYIEISKSNLGSVPADYHRKQTIAGGERFITPALKEYEEKVLGADERILEREVEIFERAARRGSRPRRRASRTRRAAWPRSTCWRRSPRRRRRSNYTKPLMHAGDELIAVDARHPVVERHVADAFVPNDVTLDARRAAADHPDRPEHGRQVDLPAADARCSA